MRRRRRLPSGVSWGELLPLRHCEWEESEGRVTLLVPRLGRGLAARMLGRWFSPRPFRVHLDDVGSFVWHRCDGATPVSEIAGGLREEFSERIEPAEERLVEFLTSLLRAQYLSVDE
jgi:hypothetical protein